eukprot:TRINITY_DN10407_c0_g1_i1.p1 TRINITY_DN10407_c0_g1~~TRINITY_DN10407_c0_g1_i1.p1  ORF type:complete len:183 (+),score=39.70 TRINITY_DN10407_c0_g1_i1:199-747(+)
MMDPPLTSLGRDQARQQQSVARELHPTKIFVSPLCRAIQTALLTYTHLVRADPGMSLVAVEAAREQCGVHTCDRRRPITEASADFPQVDFSLIQDDEDELWLSLDARESASQEAERIYEFLCLVRDSGEKEVAVTTHSAWLFTMLNGVVDCQEHADHLAGFFNTGEIRSMVLSFQERALDSR